MSQFHQYLELARPYLESYGYIAVFVGVFVEGFGLPAPGESLIIAGALFASQGGMNIVLLYLVGWAAAVLGDNLGYAIGSFGGRRLVLRHGRYVGIREDHMDKVARFFRRYGGGVVMGARFFEILRQLNGIVAGISGMPWWRFFAFNAVGAALWVGVWGLGVYFLGQHMEQGVEWFKRIEPVAAGAGVVAVIGLLAYLFHRNGK
jgi:membrane protein DedA with SNARE-associated domain